MCLLKGLQPEILSGIDDIAHNEKILIEKNFTQRSRAIDFMEFHVIDRLQILTESADSLDKLHDLKQYAEKVRSQLEDVNAKMFQRLREQISVGAYRGEAFMNLINEYFGEQPESIVQYRETGYNDLDIFLNGLLTHRELPAEEKLREPGMIYYQKTPAVIILELIKKADFQPGDVFYDLGSGLGQVSMLVNLLASVVSKGIEFEPAYCNYARASAAELNLRHVEFINADARYTDYSSGTVFFLYTPFTGEVLRDTMRNLYMEAAKRKIKIFSYGSCTRELMRLRWLGQVNSIQNSLVELAEFVSV